MSKVVVVKSVTEDFDRTSPPHFHQLLEIGLCNLTGKSSAPDALRSIIPSGTIGLKTNCLAGRANSTAVALVTALGDLLEEAGAKPHQIIVWERTSRELKQAGFELNASSFGRRCLGTDAHPLKYGHDFYSFEKVSSLVSSILTKEIENSINVPLLKDHSIAGLSAGLKNMYGAIHNPNKYHGDNCNPYAAHISALEPIRSRHRLTVIDASRVQYDKGPGFYGNAIHNYRGIILGTDPVATDAVGLMLLELIRERKGLPSLEKAGRPARYLETAAATGLGIFDTDQIDLTIFTIDKSGRINATEALL